MDSGQIDIKQIIRELSDETKPLSNTNLAELSNITPEEVRLISSSWLDIKVERRRNIIKRLSQLTEDNFEFNFDSIFKFTLKDPDPEIRAESIGGLWENEEIALISPFIKALKEDPSEIVQTAAAKGLGKYAMLSELNKLGDFSANRVLDSLLSVLNNPDKPIEVWRRALEAAAPLSVPEVRDAIEEAYRSENPRVKNSAIFAMGRNCDSIWVPILLKELDSESPETRFEAAGACGEMCEEEAVPQLIKLTEDPDVQVQQTAIMSLGMIGGPRAKAHLQKIVSGNDDLLIEAAKTALEQIKVEEDEFSL